MSTNPPPAYASVGTTDGEGQGAPPPAYEAVDAPPAYNPASSPNPSAPAVNPAVQYVNPNAQPLPAGNVQYVDQFGNPVAPPTANIQYVDQFGNPIQPPQSANIQYISAAQAPAPKVQYAAHAVQAPSTSFVPAATSAPPPGTTNQTPMTESVRQQKSSAFCLGLLALIVNVIGLIFNSLATGESSFVTVTCGWSEVRYDIDYSSLGLDSSTVTSTEFDASPSYSDLCSAQSAVDTIATNTWCETQTAATIALICMIASTAGALFGVLAVQRRCCGNPRWKFAQSMSVGIAGLVVWLVMDDTCLPEEQYDIDANSEYAGVMKLGGSMICQIVGAGLACLAACLARSR